MKKVVLSLFFLGFAFLCNAQSFRTSPPPAELPDPDDPSDNPPYIIMGNFKGFTQGPGGTIILDCGTFRAVKCATVNARTFKEETTFNFEIYKNEKATFSLEATEFKQEVLNDGSTKIFLKNKEK